MSIPLYFAMSWEAAQNHSAAYKAQLGFGFQKDGTLFVPEQSILNAPIVLNDAIVPQCMPGKITINRLAGLCRRGCFFDFERPASNWSIRLFKELQAYLDANSLLAVPQEYVKFAPQAAVIVSVQDLPRLSGLCGMVSDSRRCGSAVSGRGAAGAVWHGAILLYQFSSVHQRAGLRCRNNYQRRLRLYLRSLYAHFSVL